MSCSQCGQETVEGLKTSSGQAGFSEERGVFKCPRCGRFVSHDLICSNPSCGANWETYKWLTQLDPEQATMALRFMDLRAAILPPMGHVVTPITEEMVEMARANGKNGMYLLAGGDDIEDMNVQVHIVKNKKGQEQALLLMKVRADTAFSTAQESSAEEKLLLALNAGQPIPINEKKQDIKQITLPLDEDNEIGRRLRLITQQLKDAEWLSQDNITLMLKALDKFEEVLSKAEQDPLFTKTYGDEEVRMLQHYRGLINLMTLHLLDRTKNGGYASKPFDFDPKNAPFKANVMVDYVETKYLPAPDPGTGLEAKPIEGWLKIDSQNEIDGEKYIKGESPAEGYRITLDKKARWKAYYYPHSSGTSFSQRGVLQILTPPMERVDANTIAEAIYRMRQLNLTGSLASNYDAECLYLARNAWALGLGTTQEFRQIMTVSEEDNQRATRYYQEALANLYVPQGADEGTVAQTVVLDSMQKAKLKRRRRQLRELVARQLGMDVQAMLSHPDYMKYIEGRTRTPSGEEIPTGLISWTRLDVLDRRRKGETYGDRRYFYHHITSDDAQESLLNIINGGGVLWSTYRRRMNGIGARGTMSPDLDMQSGGGGYIFGSIRKEKEISPSYYYGSSPALVWDTDDLAQVSSAFWYPNDRYGAVNTRDSNYRQQDLSTDLKKLHGNYDGGEMMVKDGVSIHSIPPRYIITGKVARERVLQALKRQGVTHLGRRPIEEVVVSSVEL